MSRLYGPEPTVTKRTVIGVLIFAVLVSIFIVWIFSSFGYSYLGWLLALAVAVLLMYKTFVGYRRTLQMDERLKLHPDDWWLGDADWDDSGTSSEDSVFMIWFFGVLFIGFGVASLLMIEGLWGKIFGLLNTLGGASILYVAARYTRQRLKYGPTRLEFRRFPFLLGDTLDVRLLQTRPVDGTKVECKLCCLERTPAKSSNNITGSAVREMYVETQSIEVTGDPGRNWEDLAISFALPTEDLTTHLRQNYPRYWVLKLHAETTGVDFGATFLVPVYSPSIPLTQESPADSQ